MNGKSKNVELPSVKDCVQNIPFEDLAPATNVDISNYEQVLNQLFQVLALKILRLPDLMAQEKAVYWQVICRPKRHLIKTMPIFACGFLLHIFNQPNQEMN